jgi:hypothetical protein
VDRLLSIVETLGSVNVLCLVHHFLAFGTLLLITRPLFVPLFVVMHLGNCSLIWFLLLETDI